MGLHEGSGDAAGYGDEVGGAGEDLDEGGGGEVGEVDLHAVAEPAGELIVDGDGGDLGEEGAGVGEEGGDRGGGVAAA